VDFELNDTQRAFREAARQFARNHLAPQAALWSAQSLFPKDVIAQAGALGFCGVYTPEDAGGMGLSRLEAAIVFEELAAGCTSTTAYITIHNMATWMVASFARDSVRQAWCPLLTAGKKLTSYCLTESEAGSDAGALRTTAQKEGDVYRLSGSKAFISGAGETDLLVVMARTGGPGPEGISAFAVPADMPGVSYGRKEAKLDGGRINIAACSVGTAQAALQAAQRYLLDRQQFGQPLATFQALQFQLADMLTELVAARQMIYLAATKLDQGHYDATIYCAMAKRFATDVGFKVCNTALQLHGGYGCIREFPLERYLRDVRVHQILEGTNEIMRVIVARRLLQAGATEEIR
jgi:alkylation response protein AidB-like acyl-CoA dehydrogenase